MLKQSIALGAIAIALTGCVVSPFDDYDHGDRRFDRNQYDSRYDRDRADRNDSRNWDRKGDWNRNQGAESNQNRPNPYWNQNRYDDQKRPR